VPLQKLSSRSQISTRMFGIASSGIASSSMGTTAAGAGGMHGLGVAAAARAFRWRVAKYQLRGCTIAGWRPQAMHGWCTCRLVSSLLRAPLRRHCNRETRDALLFERAAS
jgi:hypothetical protein